jgi:hypothetical protein
MNGTTSTELEELLVRRARVASGCDRHAQDLASEPDLLNDAVNAMDDNLRRLCRGMNRDSLVSLISSLSQRYPLLDFSCPRSALGLSQISQ